MVINNIEYPNVLIKFGKLEHLRELKEGIVYFNQAEYFRKQENNNGFDTREGKIRINPSELSRISDPTIDLIKHLNIEEVNISSMKSGKTPIFCCSEIDSSNIKSLGNNKYCLSDTFINEMKQWGSTLLVMSKDEFCSKVEKSSIKLEVKPYMSKMKYDQDISKTDEKDLKLILRTDRYDTFFHKTSEYAAQNEFRIILGDENLIPKSSNHFYLAIGKLETAKIFDLNELTDLIFNTIEKTD